MIIQWKEEVFSQRFVLNINKGQIRIKSINTQICKEVPAKDNPYLAQKKIIHGYDLFDLIEKRSFVDVLYLLFSGELPNRKQAKILEKLMIAFANPGPRHPAVRASMNAGIGKTNTAHILPIGLTTLGGDHCGAQVNFINAFFLKAY